MDKQFDSVLSNSHHLSMKTKKMTIYSPKYIVPLIALLVLVGAVGYIEHTKTQNKKLFIAKAYEYTKTQDPSKKTALEGELNELWAHKGIAKQSNAMIPGSDLIGFLIRMQEFCENWATDQYYAAGSQWVAIEDPYFYCTNHSLSLMLSNTAD